MDLVSQGLLGSSLAITLAKAEESRKAGLIGLIAGLSADLDFFIQSSQDPLLNLEFHRHFSHSVFFIPIAALVLSLLLWPIFRNYLAWHRIYLFCFAGYLLSGLLDACTSYGTRLLWPLSEERFSFNIISIVDPVFTLSLILGVLLSVIFKRKHYAQLFLILCSLYLVFGWTQNQRIQEITLNLAKGNHQTVKRILVKPTLGNLWLWRSVYQAGDIYHVNAIRLNPFTGEHQIFAGGKVNSFNPLKHDLPIQQDSVLQQDIIRFDTFSNGFLALDANDENLIIDVRYSNLPHTIKPLWGIRIDVTQPNQHAQYELMRDKSPETRQQFIDMLFNKT